VTNQVSDVVHAAGAQVVHSDDLMPLGQQAITQVRTDEPGPAGNKYAQVIYLHNSPPIRLSAFIWLPVYTR